MNNSGKLDALAIAAHPDDVEITCGGLLIKLAEMDRKVGVLDLTRGEMGTLGDEHGRANEAAAAAKVMGLSFRGNLELPDSALMMNQENRLKVANFIRATRPELIILPHWEQRHPDHLVACNLGYDACYLSGLKKLDIDNEPWRPRKIIYASYYRNSENSFLVDISGQFNRKIEAVAAYKSQFGEGDLLEQAEKAASSIGKPVSGNENNIFQPGVNVFDLINTRDRQLGQRGDCSYAEGYTVKERIVIDDPQNMLVPSI